MSPRKLFQTVALSAVILVVKVVADKFPSEFRFDELNNPYHLQPRLGSFDEEYRLFQAELENGTAKSSGKSRNKRYVYLNTETNLDVGYLIVIPITIVLPSMTNLFNNWRRKRSLDNFDMNVTSVDEDPVAQSQVDQISAYFDLMNIPEKACQLRAMCELSAEPSSFFPLSDILMSKLRVASPGMDWKASQRSSSKPTFFQMLTQAADEGVSSGREKCELAYGKGCKYSLTNLLNMPVMKFWQNVQSKLKLKFEDDPAHATI